MDSEEVMDLKIQLGSTLSMINAQIGAAEVLAMNMRIHVSNIRDGTGAFMMAPLLVARAQTLHALTLLQTQKEI
jgi:hypothetical protein